MYTRKLHFTIIDDDNVYQLILKKTLEKHELSASILQFYNGEEAMEYFKVHAPADTILPDIILLDINMPYMNGWQFLEAFESLYKDGAYRPSIHVVSSSPAREDIEMAELYSRVKSYIVKPVTRETIISIATSH